MGITESKSELYENSIKLFSELEQKTIVNIFVQICGESVKPGFTGKDFQVRMINVY